MSEQPDADSLKELLARSTLADSIRINFDGQIASENDARALCETTFAILKMGGSYLDLQGLDGVSIADDYLAALHGVERGFGERLAPTPTSDGFGIGLAMTLPVQRSGTMKSHIVLDSRLGRPLIDPDGAGYDFAVHTLMHEAAHAHDLQIQYRCVPGFYGSPIKSFCERTLVELTLGAWDEYIASRLSAPWGTPKYVPSFEVELIVMLASVRQRGNGAVTEYNEHHEIVTTATKMVSIYGSLLVRASYILGHADGIGTDLAVQAPRWSQLVESTPWFSPYWTQYCAVLCCARCIRATENGAASQSSIR